MTSKIEDIDSEYSLISVAREQKAQHAIEMEKNRIAYQAAQKQKQKEMQIEIERRSKVFEQQRAKNLEE